MPKVKTISVSQINTYETCPLQWYYNYILKLIQLPNPAFIIGTAYHKCLEKFHKGETKEQIILDLKKQILSGKPTNENIEQFGLIRKMFEKYIKNPVKGQAIETEWNFSIPIQGVPIPFYGFIDRRNTNEIIEYKTSSFDYEEKDIKTTQSKGYTYAVFKKTGKIFPVRYSVNNKGKANNDNYVPQQMVVQYTEQDMKDFEEYLKKYYNEIESKDKFNPTPGVHCRWCGYGKNGTGNCKYSI
jgi:CRISPR/Cas system-associated exonuclease Cas4 (RecB family)